MCGAVCSWWIIFQNTWSPIFQYRYHLCIITLLERPKRLSAQLYFWANYSNSAKVNPNGGLVRYTWGRGLIAICPDTLKIWILERDLTNGPLSCDRAIRYSGLGVHLVGHVRDFLDWLIIWILELLYHFKMDTVYLFPSSVRDVASWLVGGRCFLWILWHGEMVLHPNKQSVSDK